MSKINVKFISNMPDELKQMIRKNDSLSIDELISGKYIYMKKIGIVVAIKVEKLSIETQKNFSLLQICDKI